ncbi:RNA-guided endonuclease InsQ/TnpB family protein [Micromonospora sp. DT233]|uniref:RNA-guided endonuclease InsQ/TnpB family protein n=1 Tax=Micromonospora sp. DT233 TaxID=3393432 RepID=UPI003CE890B5
MGRWTTRRKPTRTSTAYRNFFNSLSGKRKGRKVAPSRFRLRLPKVGDVLVRWSRALPSDPSSVTVIRDAAGRYFASFVVQSTDAPLPPVDSEVGIDLGLTHFAVLSDGRKVAAPKFLRRAARKLRRLQQDLARKQRGSQNGKKAVVKVACAHARVADTRRDWQHKLSTVIIRDNQAVCVEDLCVSGLGRTRLAKSVRDAGWASFTAMVEYKAARCGRAYLTAFFDTGEERQGKQRKRCPPGRPFAQTQENADRQGCATEAGGHDENGGGGAFDRTARVS